MQISSNEALSDVSLQAAETRATCAAVILFNNASVGAPKRYFGWRAGHSECPHVFEIISPIAAEIFLLRFH